MSKGHRMKIQAHAVLENAKSTQGCVAGKK